MPGPQQKLVTGPVALVNIYGPDGALCAVGDQLPLDWPSEFVAELIATGGAHDVQPAPEPEPDPEV